MWDPNIRKAMQLDAAGVYCTNPSEAPCSYDIRQKFHTRHAARVTLSSPVSGC